MFARWDAELMVRARRGEKLLLNKLLTLVAGYIGDVGAAKKFLLERFDFHGDDWDFWDFSVDFEVVPTGGSRPPPPISALAVELGFWLRDQYGDSQIDVDWEACSAVRVGPLMWVDYEPDDPYDPDEPIGGRRYRVLFDLHYQVTLRVSLIRINPEPIIAWLDLLGLTPPATASSPSASHHSRRRRRPPARVPANDTDAPPRLQSADGDAPASSDDAKPVPRLKQLHLTGRWQKQFAAWALVQYPSDGDIPEKLTATEMADLFQQWEKREAEKAGKKAPQRSAKDLEALQRRCREFLSKYRDKSAF
jgi:hypothetical protein